MYEVELKVRADHDEVRERLAALDAAPIGAVVQEDTYYDAPHRDFAATDEALRIRRECDDEDVVRITYKGPLVDDTSKTREEFETELGDGETADAILDSLGFDPVATVRKERERFALDSYTVTLDAVDDIGEFVEVETEATESELDTAREGARETLESLGLDAGESIRTSYLELLLAERTDRSK
jgi:adenylate cyclase class 2